MSEHAILSPSGATRWLACTPSARFEMQFSDTTSEAAKEGTLAHAIGELILRYKLGLISQPKYSLSLKEFQKHELYGDNMLEYCEDYAVFVMERFYEAQSHTKDARIELEQKIDLTAYVEEGFGTGDAFIIADKILDFIDLKYGKGVQVSAENNKQMMLYALGALESYSHMYDIQRVRMTIYQPRIDNFSSYEIPVEDLLAWGENELRPLAKLAFAGEGDFIAGDHCKFCRGKAICKANAEFQLVLAKYDFAVETMLKDEDISDILNRASAFTNWLESVKEFALKKAIDEGKKWPGYKLVAGRSNRCYADPAAIAAILIKNGIPEDSIYTKKILGITAMEAAITKGVFNRLVADHVVKPPGKPTLAPSSDKRPELNSNEAAISDFSEFKES